MVPLFQMMQHFFLKVVNSLVNWPSKFKDRVYCIRLRQLCTIADSAELTPSARVFNPVKKDAVCIGSNSLCMGELQVLSPIGSIRIGDWCYIGPNSKLWAKESVTIGDRVFISHGVHVFDNNSHSLSPTERHERFKELRNQGCHQIPETVAHKAVTIEDDVWIGFNSAVLKGVTIGRGAIVGACSVVTHDVKPYTVVVGNPARPVKEIEI